MRRNPECHRGTLGWAAIGAFVLAWDITQEESLTHAFERGRTHPIGKYAVWAATAVTVAHLAGNVIPKQYDPFYIALELKGERKVESES